MWANSFNENKLPLRKKKWKTPFQDHVHTHTHSYTFYFIFTHMRRGRKNPFFPFSRPSASGASGRALIYKSYLTPYFPSRKVRICFIYLPHTCTRLTYVIFMYEIIHVPVQNVFKCWGLATRPIPTYIKGRVMSSYISVFARFATFASMPFSKKGRFFSN